MAMPGVLLKGCGGPGGSSQRGSRAPSPGAGCASFELLSGASGVSPKAPLVGQVRTSRDPVSVVSEGASQGDSLHQREWPVGRAVPRGGFQAKAFLFPKPRRWRAQDSSPAEPWLPQWFVLQSQGPRSARLVQTLPSAAGPLALVLSGLSQAGRALLEGLAAWREDFTQCGHVHAVTGTSLSSRRGQSG